MTFYPQYLTAAGGGVQAWQFQPENYGALGNGVEFLVTTVAGTSGITAATPVFTSTAVDAGKNFMACGAGGAIPGGPWIDVIATVTSPTTATTVGTCPTGGSGSGLAAVMATDDRLAIDACVTAAHTYAEAHNYFAQVVFKDKLYGLGANLFQSQEGVSGATLTYNAQVRQPVPSDQTGETGSKLEVQFIGTARGGQTQFWMGTNLNVQGTALVSFSNGPNTPSATFGQQSLIGGPSAGSGTIGGDNGFFNAKAVVEGISLVQPGWSNSIGLDLQWIAACRIDGVTSTGFAPSGTSGGGVNPYSGWPGNSFWLNNKVDCGIRLPNSENNDEVLVRSVCMQGLRIGILCQADHVNIDRLSVNSIGSVIEMALGGINNHALNITQMSWENCPTAIQTSGSGSKVECFIVMDGENQPATDISDTGNNLYGVCYWSDPFRSPEVPTISGASGLKIVNNALGPGHWSSPPAVPGSTSAQQNTAWRDAYIVLHTGAGVTVSVINIDGTATGQTMAASSSLALPVVPGGKNITLTYAGGTPTWDWWLA